MPVLLSQAELTRALSTPDLTDPLVVSGHALQTLIRLTQRALQQTWSCQVRTLRSSPVVPIENNYDRLNYPLDGVARDARYTRYITPRYILRTQTSSAIPDALAGMHGESPADLLLLLPGIVYRRDCIDRLHCAEPHQLDIWRLVNHKERKPMRTEDLHQMIQTLMNALLPGHEWRTVPSPHPYTQCGVQIDVRWQEAWIEVGECGLIAPTILHNAGLTVHSGLAMGLGLDRILMIRKNIPDIRLLRSTSHQVQEQMQDLSPYRPVSSMPAINRDLSLVVNAAVDAEILGDRLREGLADSSMIESLVVMEETPYASLPEKVRERLAMTSDQKNLLLRITIRDLHRTLTSAQANAIRNEVYLLLHEGKPIDIASNGEHAQQDQR
ncbi:MAG: hypothetical protein R3227_11995 [Reinekea sp.]|nr:hypothetical protein [Reinekea sp.]